MIMKVSRKLSAAGDNTRMPTAKPVPTLWRALSSLLSAQAHIELGNRWAAVAKAASWEVRTNIPVRAVHCGCFKQGLRFCISCFDTMIS